VLRPGFGPGSATFSQFYGSRGRYTWSFESLTGLYYRSIERWFSPSDKYLLTCLESPVRATHSVSFPLKAYVWKILLAYSLTGGGNCNQGFGSAQALESLSSPGSFQDPQFLGNSPKPQRRTPPLPHAPFSLLRF